MTRPVVKGPVVKRTVVKRTALIGFADALAAIESAYSLADAGFEVCAFARGGTRPALARSKLVRVAPITPPEQDYSQAVADLGALIRDLEPAAVLPLDDHAVWLTDQYERHASLSSPGAIVAGPTGKLAELALDKRQQLELAADGRLRGAGVRRRRYRAAARRRAVDRQARAGRATGRRYAAPPVRPDRRHAGRGTRHRGGHRWPGHRPAAASTGPAKACSAWPARPARARSARTSGSG